MDSDAPKKPGKLLRFRRWLARLWAGLLPGARTRRGAAAGILAAAVVCAAFFGIFLRPGLPGVLDPLFGVVYFLVLALLMGLALWLAYRLLLILPHFLSTLGFLAFFVLIFSLADVGIGSPLNILTGIVIAVSAALLGGGVARLFHPEFRFFRQLKKGFVILCVVGPLVLYGALVIWMMGRGSREDLAEPPIQSSLPAALSAPNPARPGPHTVQSLTYGSGENHRRPEFGADADLKTESVDATPFVKGSKGWKVKLRHWYWGFDFKEFPVNGTVWYPEGDGPFPLVLIVHGNHRMQEYSDPGYAYLGELMASRGFIFVSVDENFFNGAFMSGLSRENDGRGWMLLQHLKVWRAWNQDTENPFFGKVDMDNIGLIGHSRGGEAAAIAGAFNRLPFYPDDATLAFDFNFNIKAIIAIAPSDQQYRPTGRPRGFILNRRALLSGEEQRTLGRVYMSAFLEVCLHGDTAYLPMFQDHRVAADWLPRDIYVNRFEGSTFRLVCGFEEDVDVTTGTLDGISITQEGLAVWREADLKTRGSGTKQDNVVFVGWRGPAEEREGDAAPYYAIQLPEGLPGDLELTEESLLVFALTSADEKVPEPDEDPEEPGGEDTEGEAEEAGQDQEDRGKDPDEEKKDSDEGKKPLELSIELEDAAGVRVRLPLDRFMPVPPVTKSRFLRIRNESGRMGKAYEPTLQTYRLPIRAFLLENPGFDPRRVRSVRFVFDRGREGVLLIDRIGFALHGPGD